MTDQEYAELVLRRYARQTNRSIAGRVFDVTGRKAAPLTRVLQDMGARVARAGADARFDTDADPLGVDFAPGRCDSAARRIDWAARHMPVVAGAIERLGRLAGTRIGVSLVLEPKTAVLALALAGAGAEVSVLGHAEETDQEVAADLRRRGVTVFADPDPAREAEQAEAFLAQQLDLLLDDGSHLIRRLADRPGYRTRFAGAAEETTSGLRPLRGRVLPFPVVAVNDARSKTYFDNAHGTGQSVLFTALDLLAGHDRPWPLAGRTVAVAGFGPVGEGFARHARALGARVVVADPDPVAELRARYLGHRTGPLVELAADAELIVSATGYPRTIGLPVLEAAREDAAIVVAGGVADEVDLGAAVAAGATWSPCSPRVERLTFPTGHAVMVLDRAGCLNCTAGEGNPIEIMDLSFGVQLAAVERLLTGTLDAGLHPIPPDADARVAALALRAQGTAPR